MNNYSSADENIVMVPCSLCKSESAMYLFDGSDERFHIDDKRYAVVRCNRCDLVRLSPRPSDQLLPQYYPDSFYSHRFISDRAGVIKRFIKTRRAKSIVSEKLSIVNNFVKTPGLLVDVGCAAGEFLSEARKTGWDVCGVEYNPETARRVGNELDMDIRCGSILDVELPSNVKVCTFWASMEHIGDPRKALEKVSEVLIDNGFVIVLVPNFDSWESRISGVRWPHLDIPRHLYHFEPKTLAGLAREAGLKVISMRTPNTKLAASHWSSALLPSMVCKGRVLGYTFSPITWLLTHVAVIAGANHTLVGVFEKK